MKRLFPFLLRLLLLLCGLLILFLGIHHFTSKKTRERSNERYMNSRIEGIKKIVKLTAVEQRRLISVKDTIDQVGYFAIAHFNVRISYDVEKMRMESEGDTLKVYLPKEEIRILEDEHEGFQVIDTWGTTIWNRIVGVTTLSADAENKARQKAKKEVERLLEKEGVLQKSRDAATSQLLHLFSLLPGTVIIIDDRPTPILYDEKVYNLLPFNQKD